MLKLNGHHDSYLELLSLLEITYYTAYWNHSWWMVCKMSRPSLQRRPLRLIFCRTHVDLAGMAWRMHSCVASWCRISFGAGAEVDIYRWRDGLMTLGRRTRNLENLLGRGSFVRRFSRLFASPQSSCKKLLELSFCVAVRLWWEVVSYGHPERWTGYP